MKFLERETISKNEKKPNRLYVFGENKKSWIGFFENGFFLGFSC